MVERKKAARPIGIAHNPQVGTIVVMDDGRALRLRLDDQHAPQGWEELPGFDVPYDEDSAQ